MNADDELVIGDPHLCKFRLAGLDEEPAAPRGVQAELAAAAAPAAPAVVDATAPAPPVSRQDVLEPAAGPVAVATLEASAAAAVARADSLEAVQSLEEDVGVSLDVWRARVSAQAVAARAGVAPPQQAPAGRASGLGALLLDGVRSAFISNSNVQINNNLTINVGAPGAPPLAEAKAALVRSLLGVDGGARADAAQRQRIEALCRSLEAATPAAAPLRSPLLNGQWTLQYTTDDSLLGVGRLLRPVSVCFTLDVFSLKLLREDAYAPLPFLRWTAASVADLLPKTESRTALRYRGFRIAGLDVPAPPRTPSRAALSAEAAMLGEAGGEPWLEVRYLDYDLLIQRTSGGQVNVLTRKE
jgi:hypothetical protein